MAVHNSLQDRFANSRSLPPVDPHQDWFLLRAEEENGYTTLEFTRNYTSCDNRDRNINVSQLYSYTVLHHTIVAVHVSYTHHCTTQYMVYNATV